MDVQGRWGGDGRGFEGELNCCASRVLVWKSVEKKGWEMY